MRLSALAALRRDQEHIPVCNQTHLIVNLSSPPCIRYQMYQIPNLSDTNLQIPNMSEPYLSDTAAIRYLTYEIPNMSDTEPGRCWTNKYQSYQYQTYPIPYLSDVKSVRYQTLHIVNLSDTEFIRYGTCQIMNLSVCKRTKRTIWTCPSMIKGRK